MWLRFYGANSLVAYMVGDHVSFFINNQLYFFMDFNLCWATITMY